MLELVLYNLSSSWLFITIFFVLLFIIGCAIFLATRKFDLRDGKIKTYGLLLNMTNKDIFVLSVIIVRAFVIIYSVVVYQENIYMYLAMIAVISVVLIVTTLKNVFYEIINTIALMALIYFTYTLNNYVVQVESSGSILIIKTILISFAILYTTYISLRGFEDITTNNKNINE